jgi:hypothetical protein
MNYNCKLFTIKAMLNFHPFCGGMACCFQSRYKLLSYGTFDSNLSQLHNLGKQLHTIDRI